MRLIGNIRDEAGARKFGDYLFVQGIENELEADKEGGWAVWISAEEELERAMRLLADFERDPNDPVFGSATDKAQGLRDKKKKDQADYEKRLKKRRHLFRPMTVYGVGPLTFLLICGSIVVFVITKFGRD